MIGRGNGDGVNFFVLEELANINIGFWLWQTHLLDVIEALVQYVFIDIAQSGELRSGNTRKAADVIVTTATHSANCDSDAIVGADNSRICRCRDAQSRTRDACASDFQEIPPRSFW